MESYPLDEVEIELVTALQRDMLILQGRLIGILDSFKKRHNLSGAWALDPNGREIQKVDQKAVNNA